MKKILKVCMIFGSKLRSLFLMSAIYSFLKYRYRQTQTSSGKVENLQVQFGSPLHGPFFDPSPPFFRFSFILQKPLG